MATNGIVLDTSAIVAVFLEEPRFEIMRDKIQDAGRTLVGAPTLVETAMVLNGRGAKSAQTWIELFLSAMEVETVSFTKEHYAASANAFVRFGKGHHPARLNLGDCLAYAVADIAGLPLLYTGDDFSKTDIEAA
jgi:ribonuclease VapC